MPVHDWTRIDAGIFHDFHSSWIASLRGVLNSGLLPEGYYALAEQHAGSSIADLLTLHGSPAASLGPLADDLPDTGGTAVATAPPRVSRQFTLADTLLSRRRTIAIRHVSKHRLIALIEIISPANKDRARHVLEFAEKGATALESGVHVLLLDLFPPGKHDPNGMHGAIQAAMQDQSSELDRGIQPPPLDRPITFASFSAGATVEVYLEHHAVGSNVSDMPLFLKSDRYITLPLAATYDSAYQSFPAYWRGVVEGAEPNR